MKELLNRLYGLNPTSIEKSSVGAGFDTYFVTCVNGKYVVKFLAQNEINHPETEVELCKYLNRHGIPCSQFLRNNRGDFLSTDASPIHVQQFIEGRLYGLHEALDWLLIQSAQMPGKIHAALKDYSGVPVGIGTDFFQCMIPEWALESYEHSLSIANSRGEGDIAADLRYRIALMKRFPEYDFGLDKLTCQATHGDYFISQILCGNGKIN